ncbi:hypothetical protein [Paracoccus binzhouensis]|uniref:hypothetical protein n=1 Tax=Paracoccus binzhouensis TaxID=2796149 RepID=UPI0018EECE17|nr:hypothetical protein [Paracoccus binzhouensis]
MVAAFRFIASIACLAGKRICRTPPLAVKFRARFNSKRTESVIFRAMCRFDEILQKTFAFPCCHRIFTRKCEAATVIGAVPARHQPHEAN